MTPYTNCLYFGVLLYVAVPTIVHGLFGRLRSWSRGLIVLAMIFMLVIQYAMPQTVWPGTEVLTLWLGHRLRPHAVELFVWNSYTGEFPSPISSAQYSRVLGSLEHQPVDVVSRLCLRALCYGCHQG